MTASGSGAGAAPLIGELIDEATVQAIVAESWLALIGEEEPLVPLAGRLPADVLSSWVEVVGPWSGAVVLTCGWSTAAELTRSLLREHAPAVLEPADVEDALGELANVVGGNVKGVLPGPSVLGLPEVGTAPEPGPPGDVCRVEVLWRGQPITVCVQGATRALQDNPHTPHENEVAL